jgi:histidinol phosphatase-like enzyme
MLLQVLLPPASDGIHQGCLLGCHVGMRDVVPSQALAVLCMQCLCPHHPAGLRCPLAKPKKSLVP